MGESVGRAAVDLGQRAARAGQLLRRSLLRIMLRISCGSRLDRLESEIAEYESELCGLLRLNALDTSGSPTAEYMIKEELKKAGAMLACGRIDRGWRHLHTAERIQALATCNVNSRIAMAQRLRTEASKLSEWRRTAVLLILGSAVPSRFALHHAMMLRDEHYSNDAYKHNLLRNRSMILGLVLLAGVISFLVPLELWNPSKEGPSHYAVMLFGLLGAAFSAAVIAPPRSSIRIPEMASDWSMTMLRLVVGPVAAMVLFVAVNSSFCPNAFVSAKAAPAMLMIAFAAGFSQRLVPRAVASVAGER